MIRECGFVLAVALGSATAGLCLGSTLANMETERLRAQIELEHLDAILFPAHDYTDPGGDLPLFVLRRPDLSTNEVTLDTLAIINGQVCGQNNCVWTWSTEDGRQCHADLFRGDPPVCEAREPPRP